MGFEPRATAPGARAFADFLAPPARLCILARVNPRPPLRAGHGNRRRRPPAQAAARRHARWLLAQFRRLGHALRALPGRLRSGAVRDGLSRARDVVAERSRALAPAARRTFADLGKGVGRGASGLGKTAAAGGRGFGALAGRVATRVPPFLAASRRLLARLAVSLRTVGRALLRGGERLAYHTGRLTILAGHALWHHRAAIGALALRAAWWGALALLWFGGRALVDLQAPLVEAALPLFLVGLALCLPLFFARAARLRWGGLALGVGHAVLAVAVWTLGAPA